MYRAGLFHNGVGSGRRNGLQELVQVDVQGGIHGLDRQQHPEPVLVIQLADRAATEPANPPEPSVPDQTLVISQLELQIEQLTARIAEKDDQLTEKDDQIAAMDGQIAEKDDQIAQLGEEQAALIQANAQLSTQVDQLREEAETVYILVLRHEDTLLPGLFGDSISVHTRIQEISVSKALYDSCKIGDDVTSMKLHRYLTGSGLSQTSVIVDDKFTR